MGNYQLCNVISKILCTYVTKNTHMCDNIIAYVMKGRSFMFFHREVLEKFSTFQICGFNNA